MLSSREKWSRWGRRFGTVAVWLSAGSACGNERAPFVEVGPGRGKAGSSGSGAPRDGGASPGDGGAGPGDGGASPGDGGTSPGDGGASPGEAEPGGASGMEAVPQKTGVFDPTKIYVKGMLRGGGYGIASVDDLQTYYVALESNTLSKFRGSDLVYSKRFIQYPIHLFTPDLVTNVYPEKLTLRWDKALANDPILDTAGCPGTDPVGDAKATGPMYWLTGPGGKLLYNCGADQNTWYDDAGATAKFGSYAFLVAVGPNDLVVASVGKAGYAIVSLKDLVPHDITFGACYEVVERATKDGFKMIPLVEPVNGKNGPMTLYAVDAMGQATELGGYPALPAKFEPSDIKLAGDDSVYVLGMQRDTSKRQILRLTTKGDSAVVYEEAVTSNLVLEYSTLMTGP